MNSKTFMIFALLVVAAAANRPITAPLNQLVEWKFEQTGIKCSENAEWWGWENAICGSKLTATIQWIISDISCKNPFKYPNTLCSLGCNKLGFDLGGICNKDRGRLCDCYIGSVM